MTFSSRLTRRIGYVLWGVTLVLLIANLVASVLLLINQPSHANSSPAITLTGKTKDGNSKPDQITIPVTELPISKITPKTGNSKQTKPTQSTSKSTLNDNQACRDIQFQLDPLTGLTLWRYVATSFWQPTNSLEVC